MSEPIFSEILEFNCARSGAELMKAVEKAIKDRNMLAWTFEKDVVGDDVVRIGRKSEYVYDEYVVMVMDETGEFAEEINLKKEYHFVRLKYCAFSGDKKVVKLSDGAIKQALCVALEDIKMAV